MIVASRRALVRSSLAGLISLTSLAACSSSPPPVLYTISPVSGTPRGVGPKVVLLHQVVIAKYLDRSQIVTSSENYHLDVLANDWWGEPLAGMINRILVDELGQRLPASAVIGEDSGITSSPDAIVEVSIERLDKDVAGAVVLRAQAGVSFKGRGSPTVRTFRFTVAPTAPGVAGQVAAISATVGQLADGLAAMLTIPAAVR